MRRPLLAGLVGGVLLLSACGGSSGGPDDVADGGEAGGGGGDRIAVATTVAPITSIVANIGGERVEITGIVPEGTNSHTFEPKPSVAELLAGVDVVYLNGLVLEEPTKELAEANMAEGADIVELGTLSIDEADYLYDFSFPEEEGKPNPHLWTDPTFAIKYADVVLATMTKADPANADYYTANHKAFVAKATALSDALKIDQATIPAGGKQLLTYHDAYAYFAKTYDWQVIGAVQPSNFEDPQPREVARIIDQVKERQVPVIFGSEVFPSKVLEQIASETGARYEDTLRDDDLPGEPGADDHSWLGLMRYDYVTMITGLGGTADSLTALDVSDVAPDEADYPQ